TIWVKFPIVSGADDVGLLSDLVPAAVVPDERGALAKASVIIWTTTPWTIPANRAISFSSRISYGLYEVTDAPEGNWAKIGDTYVLANNLAAEVFSKSKVSGFKKIADVIDLAKLICAHPLRGFAGGYNFDVPLLDGEHVTDDAGTGFVHTAPG